MNAREKATADNVANGPPPEKLKAIQSELTDRARDIGDLKTDMRGMKGHMAAFMQREVERDGVIVSIQLRIERMEQRLSRVDG